MNEILLETRLAFFNIMDNILYASYKNNINITYENAVEIVNQRIQIMEDKAHKVIVTIPKKINMDKAARDYLSSPAGLKNIIAIAIVVTSPYSNFITNLFVKLVPPPIPTKIFSNLEKAKAWLIKI